MAYNPAMYAPRAYPVTPSWYYQPTMQPVNGLVSVTGIEGAKAYSLPPNSSMPLFDADEDVLYVKTTDAAGYPTIKTFAFKSVEEPKHAAEVQADYVPRSEFDALVAQVRELIDRPVNGKRARDGERGQLPRADADPGRAHERPAGSTAQGVRVCHGQDQAFARVGPAVL